MILCRLEEGGVVTDCSIQTQEADETLDFDFTSTNVVNKIILKVNDSIYLSHSLSHAYSLSALKKHSQKWTSQVIY